MEVGPQESSLGSVYYNNVNIVTHLLECLGRGGDLGCHFLNSVIAGVTDRVVGVGKLLWAIEATAIKLKRDEKLKI